MSRVHEALRRAEKVAPHAAPDGNGTIHEPSPMAPARSGAAAAAARVTSTDPMQGLLERVQEIPFKPSQEALLIDPNHPHEAPTEEFRSLRTRLNHMQTLQPIHTTVVTSPSPAEGKSFAAVNLALSQAQLANNPTLLCDFDFRRPIVHNLMQTERAPGITDYLLGRIELHQAIRRLKGTN